MDSYTQDDLIEMVETLEMIVEDLPLRAKEKIDDILKQLKSTPDSETLFKIQDELEIVSNMSNIDSFSRTEIINVVAGIDSLINS